MSIYKSGYIYGYIHASTKMDILMVNIQNSEVYMFRIEKELLHPNISVTIRFTPIIYDWLKSVCKRENISFNKLVLQCCKNCMEMDLADENEGQQTE